MTTIRSEAERVINHTLPVRHPLTEVMGVQHYRSYEAFLLGSHSSLVVFKEKSECTYSTGPLVRNVSARKSGSNY